MKTYTLNQLIDKHVGENGTTQRKIFDFNLKIDIAKDYIKQLLNIIKTVPYFIR